MKKSIFATLFILCACNLFAIADQYQVSGDRDRAISQDISQALQSSGTLSAEARSVSVSSVNGEVTLTGFVKNENERNDVKNIAKRTRGVVRVNDHLSAGSTY